MANYVKFKQGLKKDFNTTNQPLTNGMIYFVIDENNHGSIYYDTVVDGAQATKKGTVHRVKFSGLPIEITGSVTGTGVISEDGESIVINTLTNHSHGLAHQDFTVNLSNDDTNLKWTRLGNQNGEGFWLKSVRGNDKAPAWFQPDNSAGIAFGGSNTKGIISVRYQYPSVRFAGGNGDAPVWYFTITGANDKTYDLSKIGGHSSDSAKLDHNVTFKIASTADSKNGGNGTVTDLSGPAVDLYLPTRISGFDLLQAARFQGTADNADTVDYFHMAEEKYKYETTQNRPTAGADWCIKISTPVWNSTSETIYLTAEGDNTHGTVILKTGSRQNNWWGYATNYNGTGIIGVYKLVSDSDDVYIKINGAYTSVRIRTTFKPTISIPTAIPDYNFTSVPWQGGFFSNAIYTDTLTFTTPKYWANIPISDNSNTETQPTFNTAYVSNWWRSTGNTGWWNETHHGGITMENDTYVKVAGNKSFLIPNGSLEVGESKSKFYANSSGNGYFSNTLGIAGINTNYNLYVNGISYLAGNTDIRGNLNVSDNYFWYGGKNFILRSTANNQEWSFDLNSGSTNYTGTYAQFWSAKLSNSIQAYYTDTGEVYAPYFMGIAMRGQSSYKLSVGGNTRIESNTPNFFITDKNTGINTYSIIRFGTTNATGTTNINAAYIFLNGPQRTDDGGKNLMTIRNNVGDLRLNNNVINTGMLTIGQDILNMNYTTYSAGTIGNPDGLVSFVQNNLIIGNNVDFNTLVTPGCYKVQMSAWGAAGTYHSPNEWGNIYSYGLLLVFRGARSDGEQRIHQIYFPHQINALHPILNRMHNGTDMSTGWHAWTRMTREMQNGTANRIAYYNSAQTIFSGNNIWTNGIKLGINTTTEPSYHFYVNGTSYFNDRITIESKSTSGGPYLTVNYGNRYDSDKTLDNYGLNLIKFGMSSMDNYLGTSLNGKIFSGKYAYAFHTGLNYSFGWFTSGWIPVMELECNTGNLRTKGNIYLGGSTSAYINSTNYTGNAATMSYPLGFSLRSNNNWTNGDFVSDGFTTYITDWDEPSGGSIYWASNSKGQLAAAIDGYFYQGRDVRDGKLHRCLDTYDLFNSTWGNASIAIGTNALREVQQNKVVMNTFFDNTANIHRSNLQGEMNLYRFFANNDEANYATTYGYPAVDNHVLVFSIDNSTTWERVIDLDIRSTTIYTKAKINGSWGNWVTLLDSNNFNTSSPTPLITTQKTLTVSNDWVDTGISSNNTLTTSGTYAVQFSGFNQGVLGQWGDIYSGVMSWYSGGTNSTDADEILLHSAGHATNGQHIFLRTIRQSNGILKLQIKGSTTNSTAATVTFKFRRLI